MTDAIGPPVVDFEVVRHKETPTATFGRMHDDKQNEVCVTLERPWVDLDENGKRDPDVSRIAPGEYDAIRRKSPKRGYDVWWLCGVPDVTSAHFPDEPTATTAQLHIANVAHELNGCTGLGSAFGVVNGQPGITGSKHAFEKFMALTANRDRIRIRYVDAFLPSKNGPETD